MPQISQIKNKTHTTLTINRDLLAKAKEKGINISLILDAALQRELDIPNKKAFFEALVRQNSVYKNFIKKKELNNDFHEFKYGEKPIKHFPMEWKNVVEKKERKREQIIRDIEGNR